LLGEFDLVGRIELAADDAPFVGWTLEALSCGVSHRLDLVAIKVADKCAIVVGIVILPNIGSPFVDAAVRQGGRVKTSDRLAIGRLKSYVNPISDG
jgi:hypothetical protein